MIIWMGFSGMLEWTRADCCVFRNFASHVLNTAIKQLNYVLSINSNHVDALYNLGLATYMETEDADKSIQYFDKAIQIDPKHLLSQHAKQTFKSLKNEEE